MIKLIFRIIKVLKRIKVRDFFKLLCSFILTLVNFNKASKSFVAFVVKKGRAAINKSLILRLVSGSSCFSFAVGLLQGRIFSSFYQLIGVAVKKFPAGNALHHG
jgi:hypothetical protein